MPRPRAPNSPVYDKKEERGAVVSCLLLALWAIFVAPVVWVWHLLRAYPGGCSRVYLGRGCGCFVGCLTCGKRFRDKTWYGETALYGPARRGPDGGIPVDKGDEDRFTSVRDTVEKKCPGGKGAARWLPVKDALIASGVLKAGEEPRLFLDKVEPADVLQGSLGDCWLLSGIACVALHPNLVRAAFDQRETNGRGKYVLRLHDPWTLKPIKVTIDDTIPCGSDGRPLFARPHGAETWVLLLEKAAAKVWGSYQALDGGHASDAIRLLLGCPVVTFVRKNPGTDNVRWVRAGVEGPVPDHRRHVGLSHSSAEHFRSLRSFLSLRALVSTSANVDGADLEAVGAQGLVNRHAYSVTAAAMFKPRGGSRNERVRLVRLRNPWGTGEWTGDWSDASPLWQRHPEARRACKAAGRAAGDEDAVAEMSTRRHRADDDGSFWMAWEDYETNYGRMEVMPRSLGAANLRLEFDERRPRCGPCSACLLGCASYVCLCRGLRGVCCAADAAYVSETGAVAAGCCTSRFWLDRAASSD